jgi:sugar phosphate permease
VTAPNSSELRIHMSPTRFHYGWIVVGVTFTTLMVGAGVRSAPGILITPLENEFHWSRAMISFAVSVNLLLYGLMGPFAAALMERFGLRRTIPIALIVIGAGVALTSIMHETWQLVLLWGVMVGAGAGAVANVLAAMIATRWFTARRGFVLGIMSASVATGQLIFLPTFASVTTAYGWRATVLLIACVVLLAVPLVALLMRDRPADVGLAPYGETGGPKPTPPLAGNPVALAFKALRDAVRVRDFWLLAGTFFICGASTNGLIGTHLIPACLDNGIPEVTGAGLLAAMGVFNLIGTTGSGWLSDRFDSRILLSLYYGLRGLSLIYLPFAFFSYSTLSLFTVFYGLDWFATVAPTVRLITNSFGKEKTGLVYGWIFVTHQIGGASAAFFGGLLRENFGTYQESFILSGLLCLLAAVMALLIGRWHRDEAGELKPAI